MKLTFYGAARAVTGSCHCLEACGKKILIDCGLQQGRDEIDNAEFAFNPAEIDAVIVTHAHIDHSGRVPLLHKLGFDGDIYTTRLTAQLLEIMLRDSAHIQESDAIWENQKRKRSGRPLVEPIYTTEDAIASMEHIITYDYNKRFEIAPGIEVNFIDAGHLLGSAMIEVWATEDGQTRKIVFSGDIGNENQPIIRDPQNILTADYVVTESTYGNRNHEGDGNYTEGLAKILDEIFAKGGNVIIPSFAVGRTQELLYFIREMKERQLVKSMPNFTVVVDSPLAKEATRIFSGDLHGYVDEEARELTSDGIRMLTFPGLRLCESTAESKLLNFDKEPKVIISASGMCDAGRIRHHLKHNLWRKDSAVVFVGYQAEGSFGRRLLEGASEVKMFGETIAVNAKIVNFHGLSSHADKDKLIEWLSYFSPKPTNIFTVHGDYDIIPEFAQSLRDLGLPAHMPEYTEQFDLIDNKVIKAGFTPVKKRGTQENEERPLYTKLLKTGQKLVDLIRRLKGYTNRDLKNFTTEIEYLIDKWDDNNFNKK